MHVLKETFQAGDGLWATSQCLGSHSAATVPCSAHEQLNEATVAERRGSEGFLFVYGGTFYE